MVDLYDPAQRRRRRFWIVDALATTGDALASMSSEHWKFVSPDQMSLRSYRCGVAAGQRLRLKRDLAVRYHTGEPTGEVHPSGRSGLC